MNRLKTIVGLSPVSSLLALITFAVSIGMSLFINGSVFSSIPITQLSFVGIVHEDVLNFELWRLASSQLIHVKAPHMVFNVIFLFLLGSEVEKWLGSRFTFFSWFFAGGIGTYCSSLVVKAPWNVGTGASQAVLAFACAIITLMRRLDTVPKSKIRFAYSYIVIAFSLDFVFSGGPKIGHLVSMWLGFIFTFIEIERQRPKRV